MMFFPILDEMISSQAFTLIFFRADAFRIDRLSAGMLALDSRRFAAYFLTFALAKSCTESRRFMPF
jgi:hypothetical protein